MLGYIPNHRVASRSVLPVVSILILLGSVGTSEASVYYSLIVESQATVSSPEVILQNGTAGTCKIYTNDTSAKVSVEGFGQMWLYVDTYDGNKTDWTRVGTSPYLDAIDYDTNFVNVSGNSLFVGDFGFADSGKSAVTINSVTVQVYARNSVGKDLVVFVWNGSSWISLNENLLSTAWRWENYTATLILNTWAKIDAAKIYLESKSPAGIFYVDCARLQVNYTIPNIYDYVLKVNNTVADSWQTRLKAYSDSSIGRLQNCTVYFHNATDGTSGQLVIEDGSFTNEIGPWYDLGSSATIYIAMTARANSSGTSFVHAFLEIRKPDTTTYLRYIIGFDII